MDRRSRASPRTVWQRRLAGSRSHGHRSGTSKDPRCCGQVGFESECFAFSNANYGGDFRVPKYRLSGREWRVTIEVTGKRVGVVRKIFLLRIGPHGLEFEES